MKHSGRFRAEFDFSGTFLDTSGLAGRFPFFVRRLLADVGAEAARKFYDGYASDYLNSNQENSLGLPLTGGEHWYETQFRGKNGETRTITARYRHKTSGRRMVSFSVDKTGKFVQIKSFPLNVLRGGGKRGVGAAVFRSFKSGFNAVASAQEAADKIGKAYFADAERMVRGSFNRGESIFGPANQGRTRVSR
jgi:hypothetical protein